MRQADALVRLEFEVLAQALVVLQLSLRLRARRTRSLRPLSFISGVLRCGARRVAAFGEYFVLVVLLVEENIHAVYRLKRLLFTAVCDQLLFEATVMREA